MCRCYRDLCSNQQYVRTRYLTFVLNTSSRKKKENVASLRACLRLAFEFCFYLFFFFSVVCSGGLQQSVTRRENRGIGTRTARLSSKILTSGHVVNRAPAVLQERIIIIISRSAGRQRSRTFFFFYSAAIRRHSEANNLIQLMSFIFFFPKQRIFQSIDIRSCADINIKECVFCCT